VSNVILGQRGWKVIDPIPAIGDVNSEVYAFMYNPMWLSAIPQDKVAAKHYVEQHLSLYCNKAKLDQDRATAWLHCRLLHRISIAQQQNDSLEKHWTDLLPRVVELLPQNNL
jgi:streptomycin 6-kinase